MRYIPARKGAIVDREFTRAAAPLFLNARTALSGNTPSYLTETSRSESGWPRCGVFRTKRASQPSVRFFPLEAAGRARPKPAARTASVSLWAEPPRD